MQKFCVVLLVQLHKRVIEGGEKVFLNNTSNTCEVEKSE